MAKFRRYRYPPTMNHPTHHNNAARSSRGVLRTVLMLTLGRIQSTGGDFKANVVGVSLAYQFTGYRNK